MPVADAAQAVQHSAAGDAYAPWEHQAQVLTDALTGVTPAAFSCRFVAAPPIAEAGGSPVQSPQSSARLPWAVPFRKPGLDRGQLARRPWACVRHLLGDLHGPDVDGGIRCVASSPPGVANVEVNGI